MTGRISFILLFIFSMLGVNAQIKGNDIVVQVSPNRADWNYKVGESASFSVSVMKSGVPMTGVAVEYEAGPVLYTGGKKKTILKDGTMKWQGKLDAPGFYTLRVTTEVNGKTYEGRSTVGFSPEKLVPTAKCPADFDDFWTTALKEARYQQLDPKKRLLPERSNEQTAVYEVSYVNERWGSRMYGVLSVPTKPGKYPALLRVPGAGVRPYQGDTYTAPGKAIVLEIGIHGVPVTMEQHVYDDLFNGALNGYWETNIDNPHRNYYKRVITGAVKAVDFIASLPEWNGKDLGVTGSSQGGFLSLAVAALDKRVSFIGVVHNAMCDYESELHGVAGGWPHYFYKKEKVDAKKIEGARYYDGVNFARRINVPGWFSFGYNDEVVPPTSSYGLYNIYPGPKTLSVYPMTAHYWYQEQWDEWLEWIRKQMKTM